jgi:hypoxanthine phosphoribosyltransferase
MRDRPEEPRKTNAPELVPVFSEAAIQARVRDLAVQIAADYEGEPLLLLGVLKGAFVFLSDLIRRLTIPAEIDFIQLSSYGKENASCGEVSFCTNLSADLQGKAVLVVEDIIDTGLTMQELVQHLRQFAPKSIRVCTLLDKHERREVEFSADYVCHSVRSGFLVGYGLDYAEQYRYLPAIYELKF